MSKYGPMFFGDPVAAFTNIGDAVRPGGTLVLLAWGVLSVNPWVTRVRAALSAGRILPEPPPSTPGPFGFAEPTYVREVLSRSGWGEVPLTEVAEPVHLGADADDAFTFVSQMGLTRALLDGLDPASRAASLDKLRGALEAAAGDGGVAMPSQSWLVTARRYSSGPSKPRRRPASGAHPGGR